MFKQVLLLFAVTFLPLFELRASIPLGILQGEIHLPLNYAMSGMGLDWILVFTICVLANALLGILLYPFINYWIHTLEKIPFFGNFWKRKVEKVQKKIHPLVEKWGTFGVALFIAVPLPGSGSYSGAVGAYLLGMSYKRYILANFVGVFLAGCAVTALTLSGQGLFDFIKNI